MLIIQLTPEQIEAIKPGIQRISEMAEAGKPGMLVAQVYNDHMRVGIMSHEDATKLQAALGGEVGRTHRTAYELLNKHAPCAEVLPFRTGAKGGA